MNEISRINVANRFIAEYLQIKNRYESLSRMLVNWDNGTLAFIPTCPRETYNFQLRVIRAKIKNIKLD